MLVNAFSGLLAQFAGVIVSDVGFAVETNDFVMFVHLEELRQLLIAHQRVVLNDALHVRIRTNTLALSELIEQSIRRTQ